MVIAYSLFEYNNPNRVIRLVNRIQTKSDFVQIHLDKMIGKDKFNDWKKIIEKNCQTGEIRIFSKFRCKYGNFGLIDAELNLMKELEDYNYDFHINLSGDSYPLKPPKIIKKELNKKNSAFMEFYKLPFKDWYQGGLHRLNNRYYFFPKKKYPYVRTLKIPRINKQLPGNLKAYGGRGCRCLQKKHVSYILNFLDKNPSVKKFFRRVWGPGELLYHTILLNSDYKSTIFNQSLMYIDFSEGVSHPKYLTELDLETLKRSGKFFARKFNQEIDSNVLNIIDRMLVNTKKD